MKKKYIAPGMVIMTVEPTVMLSTSDTPRIGIKDKYADENEEVL